MEWLDPDSLCDMICMLHSWVTAPIKLKRLQHLDVEEAIYSMSANLLMHLMCTGTHLVWAPLDLGLGLYCSLPILTVNLDLYLLQHARLNDNSPPALCTVPELLHATLRLPVWVPSCKIIFKLSAVMSLSGQAAHVYSLIAARLWPKTARECRASQNH